MSITTPSSEGIVGQFEDEVGSLVEVRDSISGYFVTVDGRVVQDRLTPAGLGAYLCHVLQNSSYKIKKAYSFQHASERRWIPIGELLPEVGKRVLVTGWLHGLQGHARWQSVAYLTGETTFRSDFWERTHHDPTHWMPLPEAP